MPLAYNVRIHNDLLLFFLLYETDFRMEMLDDVKGFARDDQNGLFINSCFAHCQTELQDTWFADDSPFLGKRVCHRFDPFILTFSFHDLEQN